MSDCSNLLKETMAEMADAGYKEGDVSFIGSPDSAYECTWAEFVELANREYYPGYGSNQVASDLVIVFKDGGFMERGEYDGAEWWKIHKPFTRPRPEHRKPIESLFVINYQDSLAEIDKELHHG